MSPDPKIVQLVITPNDSLWQGVLLGLGSEGVTYYLGEGGWKVFATGLKCDDAGQARTDGGAT